MNPEPPNPLQHEQIELVEPYLSHLREAATGWAFMDVEQEHVQAVRAMIIMSRNVMCLVDELRKARGDNQIKDAAVEGAIRRAERAEAELAELKDDWRLRS